jgi:hypothetical protein
VFTLNFSSKENKCNRQFFKGVTVFAVTLLILLILTAPMFVQASSPAINVNLRINASWGGGDILNLDITDLDTGERQQVAIRLSDFIREGENVPYILLQAMDLMGERQSGVIQIENPLFDPSCVPTGATVGNSGSSISVGDLPDNLQSIVAEATQAEPPPTLTPNGTGNVVDNIMTLNNIEFFTVTTDNGSDFFLVVDRQRTSNNVYLLNTVTEADLMALAEARGETLPPSSSNVAVTQPPTGEEPPSTPTMEEILQALQEAAEQNQQEAITPPTPQSNNSGIILLVVLLLLLGGAGFAVWKWLLPKIKEMGQGNQEEIEEEEIEEGDYGDEEYHGDSGNVPIGEGDSFGFDESDNSDENGGDSDDEE